MTDSINVFPPFWQFPDANGDPVPGGMIEFFAAGSSTPRTVYADSGLTSAIGTTVYCDSAGYPVASSGSSTKVMVYTGTTAYKAVFKTSSGTTLGTLDNIKGALDTSTYATTTARPIGNVVAKAATTWSASTSDGSGTLYNANVAGGSQIATLPSAVDAGNGYLLGIRHDGQGSTNTVTYQTVAAQAIKEGHASSAVVAGTLTGYGETTWLQSDGAGWTVYATVPALSRKGEFLEVTDRLVAAPASPNPGAVYLINGTPTGTWLALGFVEKDLVQASGVGSWTKLALRDGLTVYVIDEQMLVQYRDPSWVDLSNIAAPAQSYFGMMVLEDQKPNGTAGGGSTAGAFQTSDLNTVVYNSITSDVLLTSNLTPPLPAGKYLILAEKEFVGSNTTQIRVKSSTTSKEVASLVTTIPTPSSAGRAYASGVIELSAAEQFTLDYWVETARASNGLGFPSSFSNSVEKYASVTIISLAAQQGPQGGVGDPGVAGRDAGLGRWSFSTTTTASDPGSGAVRVDNGTAADITAVYLSETDADSAAMAGFLATVASGGLLQWRKQSSPGVFLTLAVTGSTTDNGTWRTIPVSYVNGALPSASDSLLLSYGLPGTAGDAGATGSTGAAGAAGATGATGPNTGLDYAFDTATTGDPGSGKFGYDSATLASITSVRISETGRNGEALAALIATWDDSTNTAHYGHLRLFTVADRTKFVELEITGTITDSGAYRTIPVSYTAGGTLHASNDICAVMFERTGNKGTDGAGTGDVVGPAASVDSEIALFSLTTGKLLKRASLTGIVKATSGVASAATAGTDYVAPGGALGTPSSGTGTNLTGIPIATGISGLGTGVATALAVNVGTAGAPVVNGGALGTPSSGTLTNATGLPVAGITSSTSTALGVGSLELGHASDTTLSRLAAGEIAVEGTLVKKVGKETIAIPAAAMTARTTNGAAAGSTEMTTNKNMFETLDFDATTQEFVQFEIPMPKSWNLGTLTFQPVWSHASTTTNFGVVWELAAVARSDDDAGDVAFGTAQSSTDTGGTTNDIYIGPESSAITVAGTPAAGDTVQFQIARAPANGSDTMAIDARLHGIRVFFTTSASTDA